MSNTMTKDEARVSLDGPSVAEQRGALSVELAKLDGKLVELGNLSARSSGGFAVAENEVERDDVQNAVNVSEDKAKSVQKKIDKLDSAIRGLIVVERAGTANEKFARENRSKLLDIIRRNPRAADRMTAIRSLRSAWDKTQA